MQLPLRYRRDDETVSPVIGEVLMVAIVIVLAVVAWLVVSDMMQTPEETPITVNLEKPSVRARNFVFDANMEVLKIAPRTERVLWEEVTIVVKSHNGSLLNASASLNDDSNATYHDYVEFWYIESTTNDTEMHAGDAIKITGMTKDYEGATIILIKVKERIAEIGLPTDFE